MSTPRRTTFSVRSSVAPGGKLNHADEVALVLLGDEAGRRPCKLDARNADEPHIDHEHDSARAHEAAGQASVTEGEPLEAAIEAIESPAEQAPRPDMRGSLASCALKSTAQRAGLRVSETKQEMMVEAEIVTANWRKNSPEMPEMKADGTNTAQSVSAIEISAPPTSSIVRCAASAGNMPARTLRSTFSTTTIASSTTIPTASTSPNRDRL